MSRDAISCPVVRTFLLKSRKKQLYVAPDRSVSILFLEPCCSHELRLCRASLEQRVVKLTSCQSAEALELVAFQMLSFQSLLSGPPRRKRIKGP